MKKFARPFLGYLEGTLAKGNKSIAHAKKV